MTIETTLQVKFGNNSYNLAVKMIKIEPANYFFIRDLEKGKALLEGKTLELTFIDSFSLTEFGGVVKSPGVPQEIISGIEKALIEIQQTWLYR